MIQSVVDSTAPSCKNGTDRYIFLDIDGPLNTGRNEYLNPGMYGHHFDDEAVRNLRRIVDETSARIVISSSWRHLGVVKIRALWKEWGLPGKIIGCTPGAWGEGAQFDKRGEEILQWLSDNTTGRYSYVVIDDMGTDESLPGQEARWITVNPHCGISKLDCECAIRLLLSES